MSTLNRSTEIVEIEENTSSSLGIVAGQNEDEPIITTEIPIVSSIKNLFSSSVDINESKKKMFKKAVNFVINTGRMTTKPRAEEEKEDGAQSTSGWASGNPFKRVASFFIKDDNRESSETEPTDDMKSLSEIVVPEVYQNPIFESSEGFRDLMERTNKLIPDLRLCLYCFSVFPENAVIKRRVMTYWWMGENFIPSFLTYREKTMEEVANDFFDELVKKCFIVPVHKKWSPEADTYRMDPFVRLFVITIADRERFFNFDKEGNPTTTFSDSFRACLVGKGFPNHQTSKLGKLESLFNCSEYYLDFKPDLLLRMRSAKVLCLGLWQASAEHHPIEADDEEFLCGLINMKFLRFISLQGVSGVTMLPDDVFYKLQNLLILDLRACHSLEFIPSSIGWLKSLTHLDISGCYLLEYMPKSMSLLSALQVLKGFLVPECCDPTNECTLDDLAKLKNLRKLSIFTCMKDFPDVKQEIAFKQFQVISKLTIEWGEDNVTKRAQDNDHTAPLEIRGGRRSPRPVPVPLEVHGGRREQKRYVARLSDRDEMPIFMRSLTKLDLLCLPYRISPIWLNPYDLPNLKKLYIRGALILDLGQFERFDGGRVWGVEVLRLKHMPNLDMDWRQFQKLFPRIIYLEIIDCPKLTLFPCDARGTWVDNNKRP